MTETAQAILIDGATQTVKAIDLPKPISIRAAIGDCFIERVSLFRGLDLWVDEQGLYAPEQHFWMIGSFIWPLVNKGVILTIDEAGETHGLEGLYDRERMIPDIEAQIRWIGSAAALERNIQAGLVHRPTTTVNGEVVWEWTPGTTKRLVL